MANKAHVLMLYEDVLAPLNFSNKQSLSTFIPTKYNV